MASPTVIVVGAGPVGLLTSLRLAQARIPITLLEALPTIENSPRAMAYQPVAVAELDRAGVLDDVRRAGTFGTRVCWRKTATKEVIASLDRCVSPEEPYENLTIGQHELAKVILEKLERCEGVSVEWNRRVVELKQDAEGVAVVAEDGEGKKTEFRARYLVGTDGGRSTIRRLCGIEWEGFTWPQQLVSTNVVYPFKKYGFYDANFMVDKENWALIAKINEEGLWRVSYGELEGTMSEEELRKRLPMKYEALLPGPPSKEYELKMFSPYRIHQRCATRFRDGRVLLAGDAAHLCNPFGGLGLTGGLLDAAALADVLIAVINDQAPETLLDKYAEVRRDVFKNIVDPVSQTNKRRLHESDPDTVGETDPFLKMIRDATEEEKSKIRGMKGLAVDMRQFIPQVSS